MYTGEIGGFIGLLLGISVITILEILDLLLYNSFSKCATFLHNKVNTRKSSVNPVTSNPSSCSTDMEKMKKKDLYAALDLLLV